MDRFYYANRAHHSGFVYQNPTYSNQQTSNYRMPEVPPTTTTPAPKVPANNLPLATIYVRPQTYNGVNSPAETMRQGTAFVELYRPFVRRPR